MFDNDNDNDDYYYKPILVDSSFKNNYKYYESRSDKDKKLSVKQYLYNIMPYLSDFSSKDTRETRTIFVWSDNEVIRSGNETDDIIEGLLNFSLNNYQNKEIVLRNGSDFSFESVDLLSYHVHKTSLKRGKSYIKSPEWVLNKRAIINLKNKDNKCFKYSTTIALNHQNIENHPERISSIKPSINQYNGKGI